MELHIYTTPEEVISRMAEYIVSMVNQAIDIRGRCDLVLTGGNSPKKLYELLASATYKEVVRWDKVYFYFGDERYVAFTDKDNNGGMVKDIFFDPLRISKDHIFYMDTSCEPEIAAKKYDDIIRKSLGNRYPVFDIILLGLGDNSHTASLFPGTPVLKVKKAGVEAVYLVEQKAFRITMTAPMINEAKWIVFLVFGKGKADAVFHVLKDERNTDLYPAQLIKADSVLWLLDQDAAGKMV
jgi:6-phosphogluconolactonase